jgi:hypothetical protein
MGNGKDISQNVKKTFDDLKRANKLLDQVEAVLEDSTLTGYEKLDKIKPSIYTLKEIYHLAEHEWYEILQSITEQLTGEEPPDDYIRS